ncbi:MAG TPA: tryptophan synthase subunit alpha [Glycomyces sp.]|nr:tryptophan synthase subunit alpha [Glycomyces sp.]
MGHRLSTVFKSCRAQGETALIAYLTSGYPNTAETVDLAVAAVEAGADVIEFGVPFSDPMGDGPVIQASSHTALAGGVTLPLVLEHVAGIRERGIEAPIALMGYCNPFLRFGYERLAREAVAAGADALVVPDLPAHEADDLIAPARDHGLDTVFFAAPGSGPDRVAATAERTTGFLYCLATDGVTGARDDLDPRLTGFLSRTRALTDVPLAVGFGISAPDHVRALHGLSDGVIVGSALVRAIGEGRGPAQRAARAAELIGRLKAAAHG